MSSRARSGKSIGDPLDSLLYPTAMKCQAAIENIEENDMYCIHSHKPGNISLPASKAAYLSTRTTAKRVGTA